MLFRKQPVCDLRTGDSTGGSLFISNLDFRYGEQDTENESRDGVVRIEPQHDDQGSYQKRPSADQLFHSLAFHVLPPMTDYLRAEL